jgi:diguanylate cyclase
LAARLATINLGLSQGTAVLGLMERAQIPPLPPFYKLLYDYVAAAPGLFTSRVRDILDEPQLAGDRLYAEFVAPYETDEVAERAVDRMVSRIKTLEALVIESSDAAREQSRALGAAAENFASDAIEVALIGDFVARLQRTNLNLLRANAKLNSEIAAAQADLTTTHDEMARHREGAKRDPLTGLANRGGLDFAFSRLLDARGGGTLSCAVIDIDHFKALNDGYGHQVGDEVLRTAARALLASACSNDIVGRSGGDEFVVVIPDAALSAAHNVADGLRLAIAKADLTAVFGPGVLGGITVSIGVAEFREGESLSTFIERADECLYRAKQAGRNRVESFAG